MTSPGFELFMNPIATWAANMLLEVTGVIAIALLAGCFLRNPVTRHGLFLASLLLVLFSPVIAACLQWSEQSLVRISLVSATDTSALSPVSPGVPTLVKSEDASAVVEGLDPIVAYNGNHAGPSIAGPQQGLTELSWQAEESTSIPSPLNSVPRENESVTRADPLPRSSTGPTTSVASVVRSVVQTLAIPLLLIWLVGTCLLLLKLVIGYRRLVALLYTAIPNSNPAIGAVFAQAASPFKGRRLPALVLSSQVSGPLSAGWIRPHVVLPLKIIDQLTIDQLHDVLVHEIAHVVRRDPLIVLWQNITAALFWPHPLVRVLNCRLAQAREEICDNHVLKVIDAPSYSRTLLTMAQLTQSVMSLPGTAGLFTSQWKLEWRVADLLSHRRSRGTSWTWRNAALVAVMASAMIFVAMLATVSIAVEPQANNQNANFATKQVREPSEQHPDDGFLTLNLDLQRPDGSPVSDAIVEATGPYLVPHLIARSNPQGQVQIRDLFEHGLQICARTVDGKFQKTLTMAAQDLREELAAPVKLTLVPAIQHRVVVTSEGQPVADVTVIASGRSFEAQNRTDSDGVAVLNLPANDIVFVIVALHQERGIAAFRASDDRPLKKSTELSLLPPVPLRLRFIDQHGHPATDLEFGLHVNLEESNWITARDLQSMRFQTNREGEATLSWLPQDKLKDIGVQTVGPNWKIDSIDLEQFSQRVVTVHVRRQRPVVGRLNLPAGSSPEGILICGFGFGTKSGGVHVLTRVRRNGSFAFHASSDHGYSLGAADSDWASEIWTGVILSDDNAKPPQITLTGYPATPLTAVVTRGPEKLPVANAEISLRRSTHFEWIDSTGKKNYGAGGVSGWLKTDASGRARAGVGHGEVNLFLMSGKWREDHSQKVDSEKPVEFRFHREWHGNRRVNVRLTDNGVSYSPSTNLLMRAWTDTSPAYGPVYEPVLNPDKTIDVNFDEKAMELVVIDRDRQMSGFGRVGLTETSLELAMLPTATYSGVLFDENGAPLVDRTLKLTTMGSFRDVATLQVTDDKGHFHFEMVPVRTPLRIDVMNDPGQPQYFLFTHERLFEPGEIRHGDELRPNRTDKDKNKNKDQLPPKRVPLLAERLASTCENVRVSHMHALVILQGDESKSVTELTERLLDYDKHKAILHYLPTMIASTQLPLEKPLIEDRKWPQPGEGEIVLLALDGTQTTIATMTIGATESPEALSTAKEFVATHRPASIDASAKYAEACRLAEREHRRIWIIEGGSRCGPCFRLSRWIDRHLAVLEKDYVIFKFTPELDENTQSLIDLVGAQKQGVPFYAIAEPDGTILTTSESLLGNIGMPGTVEDLRHLRKMFEKTTRQITAKEIDELIESLKDR